VGAIREEKMAPGFSDIQPIQYVRSFWWGQVDSARGSTSMNSPKTAAFDFLYDVVPWS
jgi:hypothetical protein